MVINMACYLFKEENQIEIDNGHIGHLCSTCLFKDMCSRLAKDKGTTKCLVTHSCHYLKKW